MEGDALRRETKLPQNRPGDAVQMHFQQSGMTQRASHSSSDNRGVSVRQFKIQGGNSTPRDHGDMFMVVEVPLEVRKVQDNVQIVPRVDA